MLKCSTAPVNHEWNRIIPMEDDNLYQRSRPASVLGGPRKGNDIQAQNALPDAGNGTTIQRSTWRVLKKFRIWSCKRELC